MKIGMERVAVKNMLIMRKPLHSVQNARSWFLFQGTNFQMAE